MRPGQRDRGPGILRAHHFWPGLGLPDLYRGTPVGGGGHAPASAAWVIVNQPDGTTTKVWPVTVGGQKLFAFQLLTGPDGLSSTAYDNSGHVVASSAG